MATEPFERRGLLGWTLDRLSGFVAIAGERVPAAHRRSTVSIPVGEMTPAEQATVWKTALGPLAATLEQHLGRLTEQFRLPARAIVEAANELRAAGDATPAALGDRAWDLCRRQARGGLDDLAQRLEPRATWERLVLPEPQIELLRSIATQTRHRFQVYERWGFRAQSSRGFGVSALFHGPSGVGKTFAAEALASDLALDLYRIDLSATVSKYIGETEKNLRRIFDAAEQSGAILLFDEADALFGKRSEVSDSHDRYANLEMSYLLQRMEMYRGLAILTTNLKGALDHAFLRRLRFLVPFPFPSSAERERIWRHSFPERSPARSLGRLDEACPPRGVGREYREHRAGCRVPCRPCAHARRHDAPACRRADRVRQNREVDQRQRNARLGVNGPVIITIDVLAVSGLDAWQARVFGDALETELARLVAAGGVPARITASGGLSSMALRRDHRWRRSTGSSWQRSRARDLPGARRMSRVMVPAARAPVPAATRTRVTPAGSKQARRSPARHAGHRSLEAIPVLAGSRHDVSDDAVVQRVELPFRIQLEQALGLPLDRLLALTGEPVARWLAEKYADAASLGEVILLASPATSIETVAHEIVHVLQRRPNRTTPAPSTALSGTDPAGNTAPDSTSHGILSAHDPAEAEAARLALDRSASAVNEAIPADVIALRRTNIPTTPSPAEPTEEDTFERGLDIIDCSRTVGIRRREGRNRGGSVGNRSSNG